MIKILVADDQADLRRLIRWALELLSKPYELIEASNGAKALELACSQRPNLMLLDVMMPGMDGMEVCRMLKKDPELTGIKILLVSARGQKQDVQAGLDAGADAYMVKPFSPQRLLDAVEQLLEPAA
jgi:two-component system phosphate regulon response regulator PhoB